MATVLITHDLGLAATYCDRIVVMEQGRVVETAPSSTIFRGPGTPNPQADAGDAAPRPVVLFATSCPRARRPRPWSEPKPRAHAPLLAVSGLVKGLSEAEGAALAQAGGGAVPGGRFL